MAEVLPGRSLLSPFGGHVSVMLSSGRRNPTLVAFRRGASRKIDPLRPSSSSSSSKSSSFHGRELVTGAPRGRPVMGYLPLIPVQALQPNTKVIESAQDLHDSLLNAGDKLVIVDFFSPGCGGCRVLYPKCLDCGFDTIAALDFTDASFRSRKDALAKHGTDRCSLGPAKGPEESELLALAANEDLSFNYTRKPVPVPILDDVADRAPASPILTIPVAPYRLIQDSEDKALVTAGG